MGGMGGALGAVMEKASRTAGNSDIGRSSEVGRRLNEGSLRFARISAAWRAQRQRAARVSLRFCGLQGEDVGMVGDSSLVSGEDGQGLWRRETFSW